MKAFRKWRYGNWFIPVVSGLLILVSFGVEKLFGGSWNVTVGPHWWIDAGEHAHGSGHVFTLANAFMLAYDYGTPRLLSDYKRPWRDIRREWHRLQTVGSDGTEG